MKRFRWFVLFAVVLGALALPASAFAAPPSGCTYPDTNCPPATVLPAVIEKPGATTPTTTTVAGVQAAQSSLPFTGGDIAGLGAIGVGAILVGFLLTRTRRSARSRS